MLQAFVFDTVAVLVFPWSEPGDPPERGTRVEVRLLDDEPHRGSYAAAQRLVIDAPAFRYRPLGERLLGADTRVFCLLSDGELQEGQVWEAAMSAAHHRLGSLTVLVDNNGIQADGATAEVMGVEPVVAKFQGFGFDAEIFQIRSSS